MAGWVGSVSPCRSRSYAGGERDRGLSGYEGLQADVGVRGAGSAGEGRNRVAKPTDAERQAPTRQHQLQAHGLARHGPDQGRALLAKLPLGAIAVGVQVLIADVFENEAIGGAAAL